MKIALTILAVGVMLIGFFGPQLWSLVGKGRSLFPATPTSGPLTNPADLPLTEQQAIERVGTLAEKFAAVRNHCEAIGDMESVAELDKVAPCLFRKKKGGE